MILKALTPAERRGAWAVLLLLALGSAHDFMRGGTRSASRPVVEIEATVGVPPPAPQPAMPVGAIRVDLNRADSLGLDGLPGIGPVLTSRILAHRRANGPFRTPEELLGVRGVGPALFAKLKGRISVEPPAKVAEDSTALTR